MFKIIQPKTFFFTTLLTSLFFSFLLQGVAAQAGVVSSDNPFTLLREQGLIAESQLIDKFVPKVVNQATYVTTIEDIIKLHPISSDERIAFGRDSYELSLVSNSNIALKVSYLNHGELKVGLGFDFETVSALDTPTLLRESNELLLFVYSKSMVDKINKSRTFENSNKDKVAIFLSFLQRNGIPKGIVVNREVNSTSLKVSFSSMSSSWVRIEYKDGSFQLKEENFIKNY